MLRRAGVWSLRIVVALFAFLVVLAVLTRQPGDRALYPPHNGEPAVEIFVVSHGYHTGLALPRAAVLNEAGRQGLPALINVATRFGAYPFIEIGWGEEEFYRQVPTPGSLGAGMAIRALLMPGNRSVLHVVGLGDEPPEMFPGSEVLPVRLTEDGFRRMLAAIDGTFALAERQPQSMGPGLYGPSLFYRANGAFSFLNLCNHWTGRMLAEAGLSGWPVLATIAPGLMWTVRQASPGGRPSRAGGAMRVRDSSLSGKMQPLTRTALPRRLDLFLRERYPLPRQTRSRHARQRPHRQSRRDRLPDHPHGEEARHARHRGAFRGGRQGALRRDGGRGASHRPGAGDRELSRH